MGEGRGKRGEEEKEGVGVKTGERNMITDSQDYLYQYTRVPSIKTQTKK
jgi:hypothetical protein